ncbi:hypothetical protein BpHYR1_006403 [Brachionus plicatilis]|uniref:Uncharacterized protein n=1 Tax=Brachionus plicatilis TaxID=10195 RepID=A0A3M7SHD9_BRAPC|nr:hypothetical protein BpHYR1_006403 [Brachionus plicatilis]
MLQYKPRHADQNIKLIIF